MFVFDILVKSLLIFLCDNRRKYSCVCDGVLVCFLVVLDSKEF